MSITKITNAFERIKNANEDSPIIVLKDGRGNFYTGFAKTIVSLKTKKDKFQHINTNKNQEETPKYKKFYYVGVFHCGMDLDNVYDKLKVA